MLLAAHDRREPDAQPVGQLAPFADQFERDVGGLAFVLLDEHHHVVLA